MFKGRDNLSNVPNGKHNGPEEYDLDFGRSTRGVKQNKKPSFWDYVKAAWKNQIAWVILLLLWCLLATGKLSDSLSTTIDIWKKVF